MVSTIAKLLKFFLANFSFTIAGLALKTLTCNINCPFCCKYTAWLWMMAFQEPLPL
jgi:hypothetical protein